MNYDSRAKSAFPAWGILNPGHEEPDCSLASFRRDGDLRAVRTCLMSIDWFFRIPNRVWVLAILLALALVVAVTFRPFVRWLNCESTHRFMALEPDSDPAGFWYDFTQIPRALSPIWTPDGTHIVFVTEGFQHGVSRDDTRPVNQVHVVREDGSSLRTISESGEDHTIDHSPSVSPDGTRIVYSTYNRVSDEGRYYDVETAALDGSDRRRLTRKAGYDIATEWLPATGDIAFRRYITRECAHYFADFGIHTMRPDGSDVRRILPEDSDGRESIEEHAWSPDGRQVAVVMERTSLDVADADGSNRRRLIEGQAWLFGPAWSPDGARIAFTKFHEDRVSLFTIDLNSARLSEVVNVPEAGTLSVESRWYADHAFTQHSLSPKPSRPVSGKGGRFRHSKTWEWAVRRLVSRRFQNGHQRAT